MFQNFQMRLDFLLKKKYMPLSMSDLILDILYKHFSSFRNGSYVFNSLYYVCMSNANSIYRLFGNNVHIFCGGFYS